MSKDSDAFARAWQLMEDGHVEQAYEYFLQAAHAGDSDANLAIGYLIESGDFSWLETSKADEFYTMAAEQNNAYALFNLGLNRLEAGDRAEAAALMAKSYRAGEPDAIIHMLELFEFLEAESFQRSELEAALATALKRGDLSELLESRAVALLRQV
jgi:TPR repeat protein